MSRHLTGACIEDVNHEVYGGIYSQMIFGESFQEPVSSPSVKGFEAHGGQWVISDGALRISGLDGPKLISDHKAFQDGAVGVDVLFSQRKGENAGLIVRVAEPGLGADNFIGYEVSLDAARQRLRLGRHRRNFEPIKDVPYDVAVGRWIPLEVRLSGPVIEILVDGKSVLRHDDCTHALPAGTIGLRAWHREASYRNLWVRTGEQIERLSFETSGQTAEISGMWRAVRHGTATGRFAIVSEQPFAGLQSQQLRFDRRRGPVGRGEPGPQSLGHEFRRREAL